MFWSDQHCDHDALQFHIILCWWYVVEHSNSWVKTTRSWPGWLSSSCQKVGQRVKNKNLVDEAEVYFGTHSKNTMLCNSPEKACGIKGCAALKSVALVAGTRNTVDPSVLQWEEMEEKKKHKKKGSEPWSKICALKPDILLYPPGARYIKEPPPNLHRIYTSEESRGAHEIFFLFPCIQIDTYIKQLKHTSVIFYGAGSCLAEDEGITSTGFGELQRRRGVVPDIVIKSSSARMLSKLKCSFSFLFFSPSLSWAQLQQSTF